MPSIKDNQIEYFAINPKNGGIPDIENNEVATRILEIVEIFRNSTKLLILSELLETPVKKTNIVSI